MNFHIDITKVNVTKHNQSDLMYYIGTLFCNGIKLTTQNYTSFKYEKIDNLIDAVKLIARYNSSDADDKRQILNIALKDNKVTFNFKVDYISEYENDYGRFIKIN